MSHILDAEEQDRRSIPDFSPLILLLLAAVMIIASNNDGQRVGRQEAEIQAQRDAVLHHAAHYEINAQGTPSSLGTIQSLLPHDHSSPSHSRPARETG